MISVAASETNREGSVHFIHGAPSEEIQNAAELPWPNNVSPEKVGGGAVSGVEGAGVEPGRVLHPVASGATLVPEGASLAKDSCGEIRVVRPVPNYAKIHSQSFESEAGPTGAAHNYRREKSSTTVTVQDAALDLAGFDAPAAGSYAPAAFISAALSTALSRVRAQEGAGVAWGVPRVDVLSDSTMVAWGVSSSSVAPHPLLRAPS
jgi:hypothetical protein